ncbi:hypothetical protein [Streptomyces sp. NPDC002566]|uniref:hypothetical protein n=1 Tax=Streptomyces sp. NPDC002566 TaxID=3364650 RepID=UPI00368299FA
MPRQNTLWTVLPRGGRSGKLRFTVHVAPRLVIDTGNGRLSDFPDWVNWPATLADARFSLHLPETGAKAARLVSAPDSARWRALFDQATLVRGHSFTGRENRLVRSYPVSHVLSFLSDRWGRFGATAVDAPPSYDDLAQDGAFGPIGFEEVTVGSHGKSGYTRRAELTETLENKLEANGAVPFNPADVDTADGLGRAFLQAERFHQRGRRPGSGPLPVQPREHLDVHQVIAATREYRGLQRVLGLALEFEVDDPAVTALLTGPATQTWASLQITWSTSPPPATGRADVLPRTRCLIGGNRFEAAPRDADASDVDRGMLRVGLGDRFTVVPVDPDGGALLSRQFADNVTRSRVVDGSRLKKRSEAGADRFSLPALRSAGLSVARAGRAAELVKAFDRAAEANSAAYDQNGNPRSATLDLYADDLVRGHRWDVRDLADPSWRSLMAREGAYVFERDGQSVNTAEEGQVTLAPSTSGDPDDTDLYLGESLMRWAGWSLAVDRIGRALQPDGTLADPEPVQDEDFPFTTRFTVPPGSLPRLRFGHAYTFRARAVDLAGDSVSFTQQDLFPNETGLRTPEVTYRRFDPVPPPHVLLRKPQTVGESVNRMVIRSENAGGSTAESHRHVLPPRTSQAIAEQHGMLDADANGHPMRTDLYQLLAIRDAARLEDLPGAQQGTGANADTWFFDTDSLPVTYLPDPLARQLLIRGLPGSTTELAAPALGSWPEASSLRLRLISGTSDGWSWAGGVLKVAVAPGHEYRLLLSSRLADGDLNMMGVWDWIKRWATAWNAAHPSSTPIDLAALRTAVAEGRHPMITPGQAVTLVHAVRAPLAKPSVKHMETPDRAPAATRLALKGEVLFDRRSTGTLDVLASWKEPVDGGPGTADPVTPRTFQDTPLSLRIGRAPEPSPGDDRKDIDGGHDFGDTRHRVVTYTGLATSRYAEHFREETTVLLAGGRVTLGALEPATLKVTDAVSGLPLAPAPTGSTDPATAEGDYILDPATRVLTRTAGGTLSDDAELVVSYVAPGIYASSDEEERTILSTAQPAPPVVRQVVPLFRWDAPATDQSRRRGNAVRIYLERPWWSSGAGEKLGVVLVSSSTEPPQALRPYLTMQGVDPTVTDYLLPPYPRLASFPRTTKSATGVTLAEVPGTTVTIAGHDVSFDAARDLWYADVELVAPNGAPPAAWLPFVRLALVRYQPNSLDGYSVSKVVHAPMAQLSPERKATLVRGSGTATISVTGPAYTGNSWLATTRPSMRAVVEQANPAVPDPHLRWEEITGSAVALSATGSSAQTTWTGTVATTGGPYGNAPRRVCITETERHLGGTGRVVYLDVLAL